jgi:hypothetical protein
VSARLAERSADAPVAVPAKRWRFILFTCRDPRTDFRRALATALRRLGHDVHYIWLKRTPVAAGPGEGDTPISMSLPRLFSHLRRVSSEGARTNIYFDSTNLCFPVLMPMLRAISARGVWCFDMHDDLLYGTRGIARMMASLRQFVLVRNCDLMVHAAPTLKERFPASHHLGNASSLGFLERPAAGFDKVLVLASFDERTDWEFVEKAAALLPETEFALWGQVVGGSERALQALGAARANVRYYGAYTTADLVPILRRYSVMLAPYRADHRLTRYLDPLRFYHAFNTGMELITTPIPQADSFATRLHIARTPDDVARILARLKSDAGARRNAAGTPQITWDERAAGLVEIIRPWCAAHEGFAAPSLHAGG